MFIKKEFNQIVIFITLLLIGAIAAAAQTTAFTYQGKLIDNNLAANGTYDMQFKLTNVAGTQIGTTIGNPSVTVANGIFTVRLDFGDNFPGEDRYLEIGIRPVASPNPYTILAPRQLITAAPYSIQATNATNATNAVNATNATNAQTAENAIRLGGVLSTNYVLGSDGRLTDARQPLAGSGNYIQNTNAAQVANFNVTGDGTVGGTLSGNIVNAGTQFNINNFRVLSVNGNSNTFVGLSTGQSIGNGFGNSFFGSGAGAATTDGQNNSFFGSNAGSSNQVGQNNSFFGNASGAANTAANNSFFGASTGQANTTGENNSFFGSGAGLLNVVGSRNSFFGTQAGTLSTADDNAFFGNNAGATTSSGFENSFFGSGAGSANTDGAENSFFGFKAGNLATGSFNSFFGYQAGLIATGTNNTFIGFNAGFSNGAAFSNTFIGAGAGAHTDNGSNNTFVGTISGDLNTTGENNTFIGNSAGFFNSTGNSNTFLGAQTDAAASNLSFSTAIGFGATVSASNTIVLGRAAETTKIPGKLNVSGLISIATLGAAGATHLCLNAQNQIADCSSSLRYKTNIAPYRSGISVVNRLAPILFNWKESGLRDVGFGAEDVAKIDPDLVIYNAQGEVEGVKYDRLSTVLVNAVKEQQTQIKEQQTQLENQQKRLDDQQQQLDALTKLVCAANPQTDLCKEKK